MKRKNEWDSLDEATRKKTPEPEQFYMVEETAAEHDSKKLIALVKQTLQGTAITLGIHLYWGFMPPLIIQAVTPITRLLDNQLVKIHLLGATDVKRPFREEPGFMAKLSGTDPNAELEAFERKHKKDKKN
jgi:hypothetical protein